MLRIEILADAKDQIANLDLDRRCRPRDGGSATGMNAGVVAARPRRAFQ
jgi:hypothetical protein